MGTISDDLLKIAKRCAAKVTLSRQGSLPALEDLDEECGDGIEEMLALLQDDEVFGEVDLNAQQKLVEQLEAALPDDRRALLTELAEQHMKHVWLQQEAAYHLGAAIGMRFAGQIRTEEDDEEPEEEDEEREEWDEG